MNQPLDPNMFPAGIVPEQGVFPPQPLPTNIRCDKVEIDGEPAARITVYTFTGVFTFFLTKQVCKPFSETLAEIGGMESTPKLFQPSDADIATISKLTRNGSIRP